MDEAVLRVHIESNMQEFSQQTAEATKQMQELQQQRDATLQGENDFVLFPRDASTQSIQFITDTLTQAKSLMDDIQQSMQSFQAGMVSSISAPVRILHGAMEELNKQISTYAAVASKPNHGALDGLFNQVVNAASAVKDITRFMSSGAASSSFLRAVDSGQKGSYVSEGYRTLEARVGSILESEVKKNRTMLSPAAAIEAVAQDKGFRTLMERFSGKRIVSQTDESDLRKAIQFFVGTNSGGAYRFMSQVTSPTIKTQRPINNIEALPAAFRPLYRNTVIDEKLQGILGGGRPKHISYANQRVYDRLMDLGNKGQNGALLELSRRLGLAHMQPDQFGHIEWQDKATMDQFNVLSGLVTERLKRAREGSPLYPRDPTTNPSTSQEIRELLDIVDVLSAEKHLQPTLVTEEAIDRVKKQAAKAVPGRITGNETQYQVRTTRNPYTYIIPQAQMDDRGELVYQPEQKAMRGKEKRRAFGEERPDDAYVEIQESPITYLMGLGREQHKRFGKLGSGDTSFFPMVKMNTLQGVGVKGLRAVNEFGFAEEGQERQTDRERMAANLIDNGAMYGPANQGRRMRYGYTGAAGNGYMFLDEETVRRREQEIEKQFPGLRHVFEMFNSQGLMVEGDDKRTFKQISNARKGATPGVRLFEYAEDEARAMQEQTYRTIDYELADAFFNRLFPEQATTSASAVNGIAYVNPGLTQTSFQGRLFNGAAKFMGQRMQLADLIGQSGAITEADIKGKNQLITANPGSKYGYSVWAPQMVMRNLDEKERNRILTGLRSGTFQAAEAQRLRETYMTDMMDDSGIILTDSAVKNIDQFRVLPMDQFRAMFGAHAVPAGPEMDWVNGQRVVPLTAKQASEYMRQAAIVTGGPWMHEETDQFAVTDKDTMPITVAESIDVTPSMIKRSNEIWNERISRFNDPTWRRKQIERITSEQQSVGSGPMSEEQAAAILETEREAMLRAWHNEHRIAVDTDRGAHVESLLAQMFPGAGVDNWLKSLGVTPKRSGVTTPLFPSFIADYLDDAFQEAAMVEINGKKVLDPTKIMFSRGFGARLADINPALRGLPVIGGRTPAAAGTFQNLINVAFNSDGSVNENFARAFAAISMEDRDAAVLTPEAMYRMNTGDFDGDTVWLYALNLLEDGKLMEGKKGEGSDLGQSAALDAFNKKLEAQIRRIRENQPKEGSAPKIPTADIPFKEGRKSFGDQVTHQSRSAQDAQGVMGLTTAGMRDLLAFGDLNDPDTLALLNEFVQLYDQGTQQVLNTGEKINLQQVARRALMSGRTFNRLMQQIGQEDSSGTPKIDNIFKYRTTGIHPDNPNMMGLMALQMRASDRYQFKSDFGMRESLLRHVDRRYAPGSAMQKAAEWYANFIADTESGYRFWTRDEFNQAAQSHINALGEVTGPEAKEAEEFIGLIRKRQSEMAQGRAISADLLEEWKAIDDPKKQYLRDIATFLTGKTAQEEEKQGEDIRMSGINKRREAAIELARKQAELLQFTDADLARLGRIQDTSKPESFRTSYSVTSVEPWLDPSDPKYKSLYDRMSYATRIDLMQGAKDETFRNPDGFQFGDPMRIAERQRDELKNVPGRPNNGDRDTMLGTFMHEAFESFWRDNYQAINQGQYQYVEGAFTDFLRSQLLNPDRVHTMDGNNRVSWKEAFASEGIGINVDDIADFIRTGKIEPGQSLSGVTSVFQGKLRQIFGVGANGEKRLSTPEALIRTLTQGRYRIANFENNFINPIDGSLMSIGANEMPTVEVPLGKDQMFHARPLADLMLEELDEAGNITGYTMLDYKSRRQGAFEAFLQQTIYGNMFRELGNRALQLEQSGQEVPEALKQYRRFVDDQGRPLIKHMATFDALAGDLFLRDLTERDMETGNGAYLQAATSKLDDLLGGYIEGKNLMRSERLQEIIADPFAERREREEKEAIDRAQERAKTYYGNGEDERARRRKDFLVQQFPHEQETIAEARGELYKYFRQYGLLGENQSINKFGRLQSMLEGTMQEDMMAALMHEFEGSPDIQNMILQARTDRQGAIKQLQNLIAQASVLDPEMAIADIRKIAHGEGSQHALQGLEAMQRRIAESRGIREALKTEDVWEGNRWRVYTGPTDEEVKKAEEEVADLERRKAQGDQIDAQTIAQKKADVERLKMLQSDSLSGNIGVTAAQARYEQAGKMIEQLEGEVPGLSREMFAKEIKHSQSVLQSILGQVSQEGSLEEMFNQRDERLLDFIMQRQDIIDKIKKKLDATDKDGNPIVSGDLKGILEDAVSQYQSQIDEAKKADTRKATIEERKRQLGLISETPEERSQKRLADIREVLQAEHGITNDRLEEAKRRLKEVQKETSVTQEDGSVLTPEQQIANANADMQRIDAARQETQRKIDAEKARAAAAAQQKAQAEAAALAAQTIEQQPVKTETLAETPAPTEQITQPETTQPQSDALAEFERRKAEIASERQNRADQIAANREERLQATQAEQAKRQNEIKEEDALIAQEEQSIRDEEAKIPAEVNVQELSEKKTALETLLRKKGDKEKEIRNVESQLAATPDQAAEIAKLTRQIGLGEDITSQEIENMIGNATSEKDAFQGNAASFGDTDQPLRDLETIRRYRALKQQGGIPTDTAYSHALYERQQAREKYKRISDAAEYRWIAQTTTPQEAARLVSNAENEQKRIVGLFQNPDKETPEGKLISDLQRLGKIRMADLDAQYLMELYDRADSVIPPGIGHKKKKEALQEIISPLFATREPIDRWKGPVTEWYQSLEQRNALPRAREKKEKAEQTVRDMEAAFRLRQDATAAMERLGINEETDLEGKEETAKESQRKKQQAQDDARKKDEEIAALKRKKEDAIKLEAAREKQSSREGLLAEQSRISGNIQEIDRQIREIGVTDPEILAAQIEEGEKRNAARETALRAIAERKRKVEQRKKDLGEKQTEDTSLTQQEQKAEEETQKQENEEEKRIQQREDEELGTQPQDKFNEEASQTSEQTEQITEPKRKTGTRKRKTGSKKRKQKQQQEPEQPQTEEQQPEPEQQQEQRQEILEQDKKQQDEEYEEAAKRKKQAEENAQKLAAANAEVEAAETDAAKQNTGVDKAYEPYKEQEDQSLERRHKKNERAREDFRRMLTGETLTPEERAARTEEDMKFALQEARDKFDVGSDEYNKYQEMLRDTGMWEQFRNRTADQERTMDQLAQNDLQRTAQDLQNRMTGHMETKEEMAARAIQTFRDQIVQKRDAAKQKGLDTSAYDAMLVTVNGEEQLRDDLQQAINKQTGYEYEQRIAQQRIQAMNVLRKATGINEATDAGAAYRAKKEQDRVEFLQNQEKAKTLAADQRSAAQQRLVEMTEEQWAQEYDIQNLGISGLGSRDAAKKKAQDDYLNNKGLISEIQNNASLQEEEKRARLARFSRYLNQEGQLISQDEYVAQEMEQYDERASNALENAMLGVDRSMYSGLQYGIGRLGNRRQAMTSFGRTSQMELSRRLSMFNQSIAANQRSVSLQAQINQTETEMGSLTDADAERRNALEARLQGLRAEQALAEQQGSDYEDRALGRNKKYQEAKGRYTAARQAYSDALKMENGAERDSAISSATGQMKAAEQEMQRVASTSLSTQASLTALGQTFMRVGSYFGRRIFQAAIREATQFVKIYDQTMHQIQAITLKSDSEMATVRSSTLTQAIGLKTSATNVAQVKADLYRQGLSDDEVNNRTQSIVKFSAVTGMKVTQATKALTTALQSGLVNNIEEAMDAMVALGDSAATTAEEIAKGMQKSAAAAKVAGVSYGELTSMLTVITSKTQLGGTQAGTALQTIFSRMRRVTNEGITSDDGGEVTSVNDVEESLQRVGISMRTNANTFRDTMDILRDLAKVWNDLNDVQKNNIMYNMAGARQSNMFQALMEGLADDNGKTFDKYLGLTEDSEGITQSKYEIVIQSINAELDELKTTFDSLIESLGSNGFFKFFIDFGTGITGVLASITDGLGSIPQLLWAIVAVIDVIIAKQAISAMLEGIINPGKLIAAGVMTVAALGAGVVGAVISDNRKTAAKDDQLSKQANSEYVQHVSSTATENIEDVERALDKVKQMQRLDVDIETDEAQEALKDLEVSTAIIGGNIEGWTTAASQAAKAIDNARKANSLYLLSLNGPGAKKIEEDYYKTAGQFSGTIKASDFEEGGRFYGNGSVFNNIYQKDRKITFRDDINGETYTIDFGDYNSINKETNRGRPIRTKMIEELRAAGRNIPDSIQDIELFDMFGIYTYAGLGTGGSGRVRYSPDNNTFLHQFFTQLSDSNNRNLFTDVSMNLVEGWYNLWKETESYRDFMNKQPDKRIGSYTVGGSFTDFAQAIKNSESLRREVEDIWLNEDTKNQIKLEAQKRESATQDMNKVFVNKLMTDPEAYGPAVKLWTSGNEKFVDRLVSEYLDYAKENNITPNAQTVSDWLEQKISSTTPDDFLRIYGSPEDFEYYYSDSEGNPLFGAHDLQKEAIVDAYNQEIAIAMRNNNTERLATLNAIKNDIDTYNPLKTSRIYTSSGAQVGGTIGDIFGSTNLSSKDLGYRTEYAQLLAMASGASDFNAFKNTEGWTTMSALAQNDSTLTAMMQDAETGRISLANIIDYLEKKVYGENYIQTTGSTSKGISENRLDIGILEDANKTIPASVAKRVANAIQQDESYVYQNRQEAADMLKYSTDQNQRDLESKVYGWIGDLYGFSSREDMIKSLRANYAKMTDEEIERNYGSWGIKSRSKAAAVLQNSKIVSDQVANTYIKNLASDLPGFEYDEQTGGLKYTGVEVSGYEDALSYAPVITNQEVNELARQMLTGASGKTWNDFVNADNQDIARQLAQQFPEIFTYMQMTQAQRESNAGISTYNTANQQLIAAEMQVLEKAGQILPEASQIAQQLSSGLYGDQISGLAGFGNLVQDYSDINSLLTMLEGTQKDDAETWKQKNGETYVDMLASMLGLDPQMFDRSNLDKLLDQGKEKAKQISSGLQQIIKSVFDIDISEYKNLEDVAVALEKSGDSLSVFFANLLRSMQKAYGLDINSSTKSLNVGGLRASQIFEGANAEESYSDKVLGRSALVAFSSRARLAAENGETLKSVVQFLVSQGIIRNTDQLKNMPGFAGILNKYGENTIITPEIADEIETITPWASMLRDTEFGRNANLFSTAISENGTINEARLKTIYNEDVDGQFTKWASNLTYLQDAIDGVDGAMEKLNNEIYFKGLRATNALGDNTAELTDGMEDMNKGLIQATNGFVKFNGSMTKALNNKYYITQWRKGNRDQKVVEAISQMTNIDKELVKSKKFDAQINTMLDSIELGDITSIENEGTTIMGTLGQQLQNELDKETLHLSLNNVDVDLTEGQYNVDFSEVNSKLAGIISDEQMAIIQTLMQAGVKGHLEISENNGNVVVQMKIDKLGAGVKPGNSGGGGGGKSAAQKLIEELKHKDSEADHRLKMLQYEETRYESAGEITNVNALIGQENDLRRELNAIYESNINKLKEQMATTKKDTDDWYTLRDAIMQYEEKIKESNNAIEENNRKIEENMQKIRKLRTALEQQVDQEIKNRIQRERDMLAGTVDMQNIILDSIKSRYEEEWKLIQKDIDKKKSALEEEKNLIDERLNKRKEAEDEAQKYEELAELRRQYALISMDSTRTKDATEIRKKITDMEKELAYASAEDEAKARQESLDEQINAYDKYVSNGEEDLQVLLDNANNFADEMNNVIGMKDVELYDWLKANVSEYAKSVNEAQKQIMQGWEDTYNQMIGYTPTYWDQVDEILKDRQSWLDYMSESQDYLNASVTDQAAMMYEWGKAYDDWVNSLKEGAFWEHFDEFFNLGTATDASSGGGGNSQAKQKALDALKEIYSNMADKVAYNSMLSLLAIKTDYYKANGIPDADLPAADKKITDLTKDYHFASGGLVNFTGPAWVDGTPSKPEAFLSATDTELMRNMLDAASYLAFRPTISNIDGNAFGKGGISMGDINITITEASFKEDADYERVAERVGDAFVRQLNKQGLNMANYSFG